MRKQVITIEHVVPYVSKLIKCAECDRTFTSKSSLQSHVRIAHPDDDEEEEIVDEEEDDDENEDRMEIPLSPRKPPTKTVTILLFRTNKKLRLQNPRVS
ncbi:Zinc finger protein [Schistosoma japonicum]|nr:Zinc finger protein [Schistosoma japonicum]